MPNGTKLFARQALFWGLVWVGLGIGVLLAWQLRHILMLAFLALLLAAALHAPTRLLEGLGLPRIVGLLAVYLALLAALGLMAWLIVPSLVAQVSDLVRNVPSIVSQVEQWVQQTLAPALPGDALANGLESLRGRLSGVIPSASALAAVPLVLVEIVVNLILIVFLSALLLLERDNLRNAALGYIRPERRARTRKVGQQAIGKLGAYVRGQLLIMLVIGIGTAIGMFVLGVPFLLPMAALAFLTEAIPLVGPYIAGVPIVLLGFLENPLTGILMAAWMFGLQQIEGYILAPLVQRHAVHLSPVVVLLAVVAGGTLAGVLGALIAIPFVAVVQVIMSEVVLPMRQSMWQGDTGSS